MSANLLNIRAVTTQNESSFGKHLSEVLSPSRPLHSEEFLRGREEQLVGIRQALYQSGRHVFIYGYRGVGKSSLAQTAAYSISTERDPIVVGCDASSTFHSIIYDIYQEALSLNPGLANVVQEWIAGLNLGAAALTKRTSINTQEVLEPTSINDSVRLVTFLCENYAKEPVIVIDEFDLLTETEEQAKFAHFVKQISDKHVSAKFIFCGIGESIDALMAAHGSADRFFHTVNLGRLPYEARIEIVEFAAERLGITVDETTIYRIARISDGFPHYVHLISEKLFWQVFKAHNDGLVTGSLFERAMADASDAMEMKLKQPYENATRKYTNDYEFILFACADGHELKRRSADIYNSYLRIMFEAGREPLERSRFNQRMNTLKRETHSSILSASRAGWYEFSEKVIRGYARLRAEQMGVQLEVDHPAVRKRFSGTPKIVK